MIQFIVEKDGSITSPSIVRGLDARLDTAALDAIIVMPDWIPAQEHGVNVRCKYSVPVPFKKPKPAPPVAPKPTPEIKKTASRYLQSRLTLLRRIRFFRLSLCHLQTH